MVESVIDEDFSFLYSSPLSQISGLESRKNWVPTLFLTFISFLIISEAFKTWEIGSQVHRFRVRRDLLTQPSHFSDKRDPS